MHTFNCVRDFPPKPKHTRTQKNTQILFCLWIENQGEQNRSNEEESITQDEEFFRLTIGVRGREIRSWLLERIDRWSWCVCSRCRRCLLLLLMWSDHLLNFCIHPTWLNQTKGGLIFLLLKILLLVHNVLLIEQKEYYHNDIQKQSHENTSQEGLI